VAPIPYISKFALISSGERLPVFVPAKFLARSKFRSIPPILICDRLHNHQRGITMRPRTIVFVTLVLSTAVLPCAAIALFG
jgi:hypothetical protein